MKNFLFTLLFLCAPAWGATYYVSDCQSGAYTSTCVAGSDSNSSAQAQNQATPWASMDGVTSHITPGAGDNILFARGGSQNAPAMMSLSNSTPSNPIVFDQYLPSWCDSTCQSSNPRAIIRNTNGANDLFYMQLPNSGCTPCTRGGYTFKNLYITSSSTGRYAIFLYTNAVANSSSLLTGLLLDNVKIDAHSIGVYTEHFGGTAVLSNVIVRNSTINNMTSQGILANGDDILIESNSFDNNGDTATLDHTVYFNCNSQCNRLTLRNNTMTRNVFISGSCNATYIEVEGLTSQVIIEGNFIDNTASAQAVGGCYGIEIVTGYGTYEKHVKATIRNNLVVAVNNSGIVTSSNQGTLIENNVVVFLGNYQSWCITTGNATEGADAADTGYMVRNNSCYFTNSSSSTGITAGLSISSSVGVTGNLIYSAAGTIQCFAQMTALSNYYTFDRNLCYRAAGSGNYSNVYTTLANAQAAGFDTNGLNSDPLLVAAPSSGNNYSMDIQSGSPAKNAGSTTYSAVRDFRYRLRDASPDIGAYEYGASSSSVPPASVTRVR